MMYMKRTFMMISVVVLLALAVTACGGSGSSNSGSGGGSYGGGNAAPTATATSAAPTATATSGSTSSSNALINTATATVNGKSETILTDAQSKTLYYFTADTATTSACTGACGQTWPALLATGSGAPTSATTLPGTLKMQTTGNGNQVAYNGHLLYTFSGDTAPGQTNGEGIAGKWFVAASNLTSASSSSSSSSYYGY